MIDVLPGAKVTVVADYLLGTSMGLGRSAILIVN